MRLYILATLLLAVASCGDAPREKASMPSPLLSADSDRLWMLARAARVGDGKTCKELYLSPDDPRHQARVQPCDFWTRDYAEYLSLNGFPTIEHTHLKDPAYWQWYLQMRRAIAQCRSTLGSLPVGLRDADKRREHQFQKNRCDPYDHARNNQGMTPAELGIRFN